MLMKNIMVVPENWIMVYLSQMRTESDIQIY